MADLRLGIDVSPLELTDAGTARYLRNLLDRLDGVSVRRYAVPGTSRSAKVARDVVWYLASLPRRAAKEKVDVLHCPGHRGPLRSQVPVVITVHDLAVLRHPETFNRWTRTYSSFLLPRIVRAAARVIAVSEFTAAEAVELLGADESRLRVVPNGVGPPFQPEGPAAEGEYALAVGTVEPRKNLPRAALAAERAGIELRVVGPSGWGDVGIESLGFVDDEELARLYRGAQCLVYPSLYEGFGLPVLEAMACGTPVVTSNSGATAEIAGDAAVLVDPLDVDSIAGGIAEALGRREERLAKGVERARQFTWDETARRTLEVYREAAS
ncbi:MAG: glycosyltransferase family 4 protein [Actinomycetota bacterium]|nr:glycosyltransferase family 4 protein [Actinomycetota bacterium]